MKILAWVLTIILTLLNNTSNKNKMMDKFYKVTILFNAFCLMVGDNLCR